MRGDVSELAAAAAGLFVLLSRSRGTEAVAAAAAAAAAPAGGARGRAEPGSAAAQWTRQTGPGWAQVARTACGLASQVSSGVLRGREAGAGPLRRGPRNLHCVMEPVRHHLRHRRGGGEAAASWARSLLRLALCQGCPRP